MIMIYELGEIWKEAIDISKGTIPAFAWRDLRIMAKIRAWTPGFPEYEAEMLITRQ
jgi:hypothetical protein